MMIALPPISLSRSKRQTVRAKSLPFVFGVLLASLVGGCTVVSTNDDDTTASEAELNAAATKLVGTYGFVAALPFKRLILRRDGSFKAEADSLLFRVRIRSEVPQEITGRYQATSQTLKLVPTTSSQEATTLAGSYTYALGGQTLALTHKGANAFTQSLEVRAPAPFPEPERQAILTIAKTSSRQELMSMGLSAPMADRIVQLGPQFHTLEDLTDAVDFGFPMWGLFSMLQHAYFESVVCISDTMTCEGKSTALFVDNCGTPHKLDCAHPPTPTPTPPPPPPNVGSQCCCPSHMRPAVDRYDGKWTCMYSDLWPQASCGPVYGPSNCSSTPYN